MYRKCTTEKTAAQQHRFCVTLRELLRTTDYPDISVTFLCEKAGLSRKNFYYLFDNKDDALFAMLDGLVQEMYLQQNATAAMEDEILRIFRYWKEQRDILDFLARNRRAPLLLERVFLHVSQEDFRAFRAMDVANHPRKQAFFLFMLSGVIALILQWHYTGFEKSEEEMAGLVSEILLKPPIRLDALLEN